MKVIIAGSRDFDDYKLLRSYCDHILQDQTDIEVVSGTAKGADHMGERYAIEKGYKITRFPANWSKGKSAGFIRNEEMAKHGDALIAFWNSASKGTEHMINIATKYKLKIRIYKY
jgi:hypothetical protein